VLKLYLVEKMKLTPELYYLYYDDGVRAIHYFLNCVYFKILINTSFEIQNSIFLLHTHFLKNIHEAIRELKSI